MAYPPPHAWGPPQYGPPPVIHRVLRQPVVLTGGQKAGAAVVGAISTCLIHLGFTGMGVIGFILLIALAVGAAMSSIDDGDSLGFLRDMAAGDLTPWIVLIAIGVVSFLLVVVGFVLSTRLLRLGGHRSPGAITWLGLLIAEVLIGILWWVGMFLLGGWATIDENLFVHEGSIIAVVLVMLVASIATPAVCGALGWWWMALAFRGSDTITVR